MKILPLQTGTSCRFIVFGDQNNCPIAGLKCLLLKRDNPYLSAFIEVVNATLRQEIAELSNVDRQLFPAFSSILDLLSGAQKTKRNTALDGILSTFYQLCCFICTVCEPGNIHLSGSHEYVIGLCVGSLAAAAVSVSRTLGELVTAGVDAVRVSLRVGLHVARTASILDVNNTADTAASSWSCIIHDTPLDYSGVEQAISAYHSKNEISSLSIPYISAHSQNSLTVSGPPHILRHFLDTCLSPGQTKPTALPLYAPYHAPHIYTENDVEQILGTLVVSNLTSSIPIISGSPGELMRQGSAFSQLLKHAVECMLLKPLKLPDIAQGVEQVLGEVSSDGRCVLVPISTNATTSLLSSMDKEVANRFTVDNSVMESIMMVSSQVSRMSNRPGESKIAIVGMAGRFPEAPDLEAFWNLLYQGLDVHRRVPEDRFDAGLHYDDTGKRKNTSRIMHGCWINDPGLFDAKFFNISPKEAEQSDPGQRLALQTAYEALEMAGIVPDRTPSTRRDRVGVFYGMTSDDYREVNSGQNVDTYFIPGGNRAFTPGKVNYFFKFSGPSVSVDTACSSSLAAIHMACNSLWRNDCDTAVAGGTNVMTNPDSFAGLDRGHFLSKTGNCNAFDDAADGYCRADAVGTVILKRIEDAITDKDPILGVISGAYTNHSAESVSITRPHCGAQEYIFSKLLNESGVHPHKIGYIEMHGTGTQAGDATEMASVLGTFAPGTGRGRLPHESLHLGAVKANVGHSESASGVTALIKVLLMMEKNMIPPHCGIKGKINHKFPKDLTERNVHIASVPTKWERMDGSENIRRTFVNNFSAAGGNTALLVEDAPKLEAQARQLDSRSCHVVTVSAKSLFSLKSNLQQLRFYIEKNTQVDELLPRLSYTTTARRMHYPFRAALVAANHQQLLDAVDSEIKRESQTRAATAPVGFVFSGQGSQYSAMGQHLLQYSVFRNEIISYNNIARKHGFPSILPLISGSTDIESLGPLVIQLGTTCLQMALATLWKSFGVEPAFVIGHSLGQYAALKVAGVLTASDTIYLTGTRARLLQEKCTVGSHAMLAVRGSLPQIQPYLKLDIHAIACINSSQDTVISAQVAEIEQLAEKLSRHDFKVTKLNVPFAFHSAQVEPILDELEVAASGITFHPPRLPVGCPLLSKVVHIGQQDGLGPLQIKRHCREAVDFAGCVQAALNEEVISKKMMWLELGPHSVCSSLLKAILGQDTMALPTLSRNKDGWHVLSAALSTLYNQGNSLDWNEYHRDFEACQEVLRLPKYSWDNKKYWIQYVHNWTLTKGDPPASIVTRSQSQPMPSMSTASVQRIIEDFNAAGVVSIIAESELTSEQLRNVIQGHVVNGTKVCTSSLYSDIGLTLGKYVLEKYRPDLKGYAVDVKHMTIHKPLILKDSVVMVYRVKVTYDVKNSKSAKMSIYSFNSQGEKTVSHADCVLQLDDPKVWIEEWQSSQYYIERSIDWLKQRAQQGLDNQLSQGMIYKIFSNLVDYHDDFKGIQEAIINAEDFEATAKVKFQPDRGNFVCNPMWIDSCGQIAGFLMNGHETTAKSQAFINHGWKSMRIVRDFRKGVIYRTYVRMRPTEGTSYAGDVYIFDDEGLVGVFGGITFQGIPRRVLDTALPPPGSDPKYVPTSQRKHADVARKDPSPQYTQVRPPSSTPRSTHEPVPAASTVSNSLHPLLKILSEEIGIPVASLQDDLVFADYGVDSLLSLTITGRIREELSMDVESSIFETCLTLAGLTEFLELEQLSDQSSFCSGNLSGTECPSALTSQSTTPPPSHRRDSVSASLNKSVCAILAEEIGVSINEITNDTNLAELGMDSLLSLNILGRLREELDLELDGDFFINHPSFSSFKHIFQPPAVQVPVLEEVTELSRYRATSTLLQGNPKTAKYMLFLLPDGSGSATSYAPINAVGRDVCVYGLNCPWLKSAENLIHFGLKGLTSLYVDEIKRKKPHGPYNLGGWSAGGICAYEAAITFTKEGESVERLILLDSPNPINLEKLPPRLFDFINGLGLFGDGKAPDWLLAHFLAFIDALDGWKPVPWDKAVGNRIPPPKTYILWAEDGVCKEPNCSRPEYRDDDPREMRWVLENRTNFGPNNWDILLGKNISIERIQNANHFTMLRKGPNTERIASFLTGAFD